MKIIILLMVACSLTGCATMGITFGATYTTPNGANIGATLRLDSSFATQKK